VVWRDKIPQKMCVLSQGGRREGLSVYEEEEEEERTAGRRS
jgi:hypothetical protein